MALIFFSTSAVRCLAVSPNFEIAKNNMAIALTDLGTKVILLNFYHNFSNSSIIFRKGCLLANSLQTSFWLAGLCAVCAFCLCRGIGIGINFCSLPVKISALEFCFAVHSFLILLFPLASSCSVVSTSELTIIFQVKLEGDVSQGVAYYKKALYYNWHYADAMYNLGVAYGEMLKFDMVLNL